MTLVSGRGSGGGSGSDGESAYQLAVDAGFVGTLSQWLASLEGTDGHGVPAGGATGQILAKASSADYDTHWVADQVGGGGGPSGIATIRTVTATSGSTTNLTSSDAGVTVAVDIASAGIITVPTGLPTGMEVNIARLGAGSVSLVAASGVTWVPNDTRDTLATQGAIAYLLHLGSNRWLRTGGLV